MTLEQAIDKAQEWYGVKGTAEGPGGVSIRYRIGMALFSSGRMTEVLGSSFTSFEDAFADASNPMRFDLVDEAISDEA
jgi:hypothetical protein